MIPNATEIRMYEMYFPSAGNLSDISLYMDGSQYHQVVSKLCHERIG